MKRVIKCASLSDMLDAFESRIYELEGDQYLTSATYIDVDGNFGGEPGAKYTDADIRDYWDKEHDSDPILMEYDSFEEWWNESKDSLKEDVESCDIIGSDEYDDYYGSDSSEIVDWLSDHDQAYNDAQDFFGIDNLNDVSVADLEAWISDHDELWYDYCNYFNLNPDEE